MPGNKDLDAEEIFRLLTDDWMVSLNIEENVVLYSSLFLGAVQDLVNKSYNNYT